MFLGIISTELNTIGVPYEFMEWTAGLVYPYFVGEYTEVTTLTEDGSEQYTMIITGTTRGSWLDLETYKEKIRHHFPAVGGFRATTDDGAVVISYDQAFPVPTGEADLKKIQINLTVKQWKGSI